MLWRLKAEGYHLKGDVDVWVKYGRRNKEAVKEDRRNNILASNGLFISCYRSRNPVFFLEGIYYKYHHFCWDWHIFQMLPFAAWGETDIIAFNYRLLKETSTLNYYIPNNKLNSPCVFLGRHSPPDFLFNLWHEKKISFANCHIFPLCISQT